MRIPVGFGNAVFVFAGSGVPTGAVTTIGFTNGGPFAAGAIADLLFDLFSSEVMPVLIQNVGLVECRIKLGPEDDGPSAVAVGSADGDDLSAQAPPQVAYLVQKRTALGGRKHRGRMYLPGVDETEVNQSGLVAGPKLGAVQEAMTGLFEGMVGFQLPPTLLHNDATAPTVITSLNVASIVATQRRRLRR